MRNSETNLFPLLNDLVKKIYKNYNIDKNYTQINEFIKLKISQYFHIDMKIGRSQFSHYESEEIDEEQRSPVGNEPLPVPDIEKYL